MARKEFGELSNHASKLAGLQPGSTLIEKDDGQLEGQAVFVFDESSTSFFPEIGDDHPKDSTAKCYLITRQYHDVGKITFTCSYIGLTQDPTTPVASYSGGSNQQPIETHPRFKEFAGDPTITDSSEDGYITPLVKILYTLDSDTLEPKAQFEYVGSLAEVQAFESANAINVLSQITSTDITTQASDTGISRGLNGARFDTPTGRFLDFVDPNNIKCGTTSYINAGDQIVVTYWTTSTPDFARKNKVFTTFPHSSVDVDPDIVSWLCIDMPIEQVGALSLYRVTEVFLGSSKNEGWDLDIYQEFGSAIPVRTDPIVL